VAGGMRRIPPCRRGGAAPRGGRRAATVAWDPWLRPCGRAAEVQPSRPLGSTRRSPLQPLRWERVSTTRAPILFPSPASPPVSRRHRRVRGPGELGDHGHGPGDVSLRVANWPDAYCNTVVCAACRVEHRRHPRRARFRPGGGRPGRSVGARRLLVRRVIPGVCVVALSPDYGASSRGPRRAGRRHLTGGAWRPGIAETGEWGAQARRVAWTCYGLDA
jgi:hypothetical protein